MFRFISLCTFLLFLILTSCDLQAAPLSSTTDDPTGTVTAAPTFKTYSLMNEPLSAHLFELPSEALQIWRQYKKARPALVLFSIHPFLKPITSAMKEDVAALIKNGTAEDFYTRGSLERSNPALSPFQTLSAALDSGLFSEVVWFFPTQENLSDFSVTKFQTQMEEASFISETEKSTLSSLEDGIISGTIHGIPLRIIHPLAQLPKISAPVVFHLDLGYFKGLYKNGVSTPVYNLLQEVAITLRDAKYSVLAATLSYSTEGGAFSLDTRFLIKNLSTLLKDPKILSAKMPGSWSLRKEALKSREMYLESDAKKITAEAAHKYPDDPSVQYDYLRILLEAGQNDVAFPLLDKIVKLDRGYAEEYLALAETGMKNNWNGKTLNLLNKAESVYPANPFIPLQKIDVFIQQKRYQEALPLVEYLKHQKWSQFFYPKMPENLLKIENYLRNPPVPPE